MKNKNSILWAACRLHRILSAASAKSTVPAIPDLSTLLAEQQRVERCERMFRKALGHGWSHAAAMVRHRLLTHIPLVHVASAAGYVPSRPQSFPSIAELRAEIDQLHEEFDAVEIKQKEGKLSVRTDPITLEDIHLGAFSIELHFDRLLRRRDVSVFDIVAVDPNRASSDDSVTHPHVRDERLCAGEATVPIAHALSEGRLFDAFHLISRVLDTYNGGSAYVSLSEWNGESCSDCSCLVRSDEMYTCENCQCSFCDDCIRCCERCDRSMCLNCLEEGDEGRRLCQVCQEEQQKESEELYEEDEEKIPLPDDPIHDPTRRIELSTEKTDESNPPAQTLCQATDFSRGPADGEGIPVPATAPPSAA